MTEQVEMPDVNSGYPANGESPTEHAEEVISGEVERPKKRQKIGEAIAGLIYMTSAHMEAATGLKGMKLGEEEAEELAEQIDVCADEYAGDTELPAWAGLALCVGVITVPRYMIYKSAVEENNRRKEAESKGGDDAKNE